MFQTEPDQLPYSEFREMYCCCDPVDTSASILVSAMNPPLDQPWPRGSSCSSPRTCIRRNGAAWETAHRSLPSGGITIMFSASRQKLQVPLSLNQSASAWTCP